MINFRLSPEKGRFIQSPNDSNATFSFQKEKLPCLEAMKPQWFWSGWCADSVSKTGNPISKLRCARTKKGFECWMKKKETWSKSKRLQMMKHIMSRQGSGKGFCVEQGKRWKAFPEVYVSFFAINISSKVTRRPLLCWEINGRKSKDIFTDSYSGDAVNYSDFADVADMQVVFTRITRDWFGLIVSISRDVVIYFQMTNVGSGEEKQRVIYSISYG